MKPACKTRASVALCLLTNQTRIPQILFFFFGLTPPNASVIHHHRQIGSHMQEGEGEGGGEKKKTRRCNFGRFWRRSSSPALFEDEAGRLRVNQMSHFTVNINLARAERGPPQLLRGGIRGDEPHQSLR